MEPLPDFIEETMRIVKLAEKREMMLRVMGACAVRLHCPKYGYLHKKLERKLSDIDFMSYDKFASELENFFEELGYSPRTYISKLWGRAEVVKRHIYDSKKTGIVVDVFFDKLEMCHTIDFRKRLELDYPTITLADILLEKMQIVNLTEKDVKDTILLLREHKVGEIDAETINVNYIAKLLSNDWGFYYTVVTNLNRVKDLLRRYETLTEEDSTNVSTKIDRLLQAIEKEPKSLKWKFRAKIGTRKRWYTEVEEAVLPGAPLEK